MPNDRHPEYMEHYVIDVTNDEKRPFIPTHFGEKSPAKFWAEYERKKMGKANDAR